MIDPSVPPSASRQKIEIAIYGGGTAASSLALALKDQSHISLHYFDPAPSLTPSAFRPLGFAPKAHEALALISDEAAGAIDRAGWYAEDSSVVVVGEGSHAGNIVLDYAELAQNDGRPFITVVDPAAYTKQMLSGISPDRLHVSKKLSSVVQNESRSGVFPVELRFDDGTSHNADILIGDDGCFGKMRPQVLGQGPTTFPVFMNFLSAIARVDMKDAKKYLEPSFDGDTFQRRVERVADGTFVLNAFLDGAFTCVGSFWSNEQYDFSKFTRSTTPEELREHFGKLRGGNGVVKLLIEHSGLQLLPEVEHLPAPTFIKGRMAMMGNAAHTMTNFMQLGPGQDVEDALILGALLAEARNSSHLDAALFAYDAVRRPRTQWSGEHGKRMGQLWTGQVADVGIDQAKLRAEILEWKEEGEAFDPKAHRMYALEMMRERLDAVRSKQP